MLIASVPVVEALDKAGGVRPGTRAPLARAGIGVMVRDGAPVPDVATAEAFRQDAAGGPVPSSMAIRRCRTRAAS